MKKYAFSYPILLKLAGFEKEALSNATTYGLGGAAAGALLGALVDRKKRLRGALLGALAGGAGGYGLGYQRDYVSDRKQKDEANRQAMRSDARRAAHRKAFDERLDAADRELARYGLDPDFRPEYSNYVPEDYNDRSASDYVDEANRRVARFKDKTPEWKKSIAPETSADSSVTSKVDTATPKSVDKPVTVRDPLTQVAAPEKVRKGYTPPKYVSIDSNGNVKRLPFNYDPDQVKAQLDRVHKRYGIIDGRYYTDDRGVKRDIVTDVYGPEAGGLRIVPIDTAMDIVSGKVNPVLQSSTDMGQRYKLKGVIEALIKDKARAEAAVKDAIGQYTPFGGKVTADSELVKEINLALVNNAGNPEGLKKALTEIAYKMPMKPEDEGSYRMMPLRVNVPTGGGRITVEKQGPGNHISEDTVKQILKLLSE